MEQKKNSYHVKEIDAKTARNIIKKYHYSKKVVSNSDIHLGVFNKEDALVGCLQYGMPLNKKSTPIKLCKNYDWRNMRELSRMVMRDEELRNSESMAISLCNKWLKKNRPDIKWLLSFSDGKENNVGYIYQATNWIYLGYMVSKSFYKIDNEWVHGVTVWHRYKEKHPLRETNTTNEIVCMEHENVSIIECKQHIYVYKLSKDVIFNFQPKPYPKMNTELPILSRSVLKLDGIVFTPPKKIKYAEFYKGII